MEELRWIRGLEKKYNYFYLTERGGFDDAGYIKNAYFVNKINRKEKFFLIHFLKLTVLSLRILKKEKPDVLISTGALVAVPILYLGKIMGNHGKRPERGKSFRGTELRRHLCRQKRDRQDGGIL